MVSDGGEDNPENLITVCRECHKNIHKKQQVDNDIEL